MTTHRPTRHKRRTASSSNANPNIPYGTMPCGKIGYHTRRDARLGAAKVSRKQGQKLTVYRCPDERCVGMPWHLTSGNR